MLFRFPVRRYLQRTEKTEASPLRIGTLQWVLARPLYRFRVIDLTQVPAKSRPQALHLELSQWTPFASSGYYIGWHGSRASVWAWDAEKIHQAIAAQGLQPQRTRVIPESALHTPQESGLRLTHCLDGYEGQLWQNGHLDHSRWWAQSPQPDEWLMFQRDAGILPAEQRHQPPAPEASSLNLQPWISESDSSGDQALQTERLIAALGILLLLIPTLWSGFSLFKLQRGVAALQTQQAQLQNEASAITRSRLESLDSLTRINELLSLEPYPSQLDLMAKLATVLPKDDSYIKEWDFQQGRLKVTISSSRDLSATFLIGALQQAGPFREVMALPGNDPKNVTFQMEVGHS